MKRYFPFTEAHGDGEWNYRCYAAASEMLLLPGGRVPGLPPTPFGTRSDPSAGPVELHGRALCPHRLRRTPPRGRMKDVLEFPRPTPTAKSIREMVQPYLPEMLARVKEIALSPCAPGCRKRSPCAPCQALRYLAKRRLL